MNMYSLDRRKFLRGVGVGLALPWFETFASTLPQASKPKKRLACFYIPDGVPMPRKADPAFQDWSWFPHAQDNGHHRFTKCLEPLETLREDVTVLSGLSHPAARTVHGHSNADQFLTGANVGGKGRPIPAENRPKRIFDQLFVTNTKNAARQLAVQQSTLDQLLADARSLKRNLSKYDQETLEQYLQSIRETEQKVEKAKAWLKVPLPTVDSDHFNLEVTPEDPRNYLRTMFDLIYLAFQTDSTRTVTYQIAREINIGVSDRLAFGTYHRFLCEELAHFLTRLKSTPEVGGEGNMLENTLCLYGSASSSFHLSRNYPLILAGGSNLGLKQGQYLKYGTKIEDTATNSDPDDKHKFKIKEDPMGRLLLTMLQQLGVETSQFASCTQNLPKILT